MMQPETVNNDLRALFQEGRKALDEGGAGIINACREEAFTAFEKAGGIPCGTEEYRYTDLLPVFGREYAAVLKKEPLRPSDLNEAFSCSARDLSAWPVLTLNGHCCENSSGESLPDGVIVCSLREAALQYSDLLAKHYNRYTSPAEKESLVSLNTAFAQDGVFVYIPDGVVLERPLQLINFLRGARDLMAFQRNLVVLGKRAEARIVVCEHTLSDHYFLMNTVTEIRLEEGARADYYQVQNQHLGTALINSLFVSEQRDSFFESNTATLYGGLIRNNQYVRLEGAGGTCNLYGVYILDKSQHADTCTYVEHAAPNCTSYQHFKGVLDDASLANFSGCVRVAPHAQQTESFQANNNLLLTDTARINSKPQLIIDADDVKCSHGATVGQMDEEALFYLRSRGIGEAEARTMLMFGFTHDVVRRVKLEPLREEIDKLIEKRLRGELSKCHNCIMQCKK